MVNRKEIEESIEQNKSSIINWKVLDRLDLDFTQVEIEALLVDKYNDDMGSERGYSLITTINSKPDSQGKRDIYSIRWSFREDSANVPYVCYESWKTTSGAIFLDYQEVYEDFTMLDFEIIPQSTEVDESTDELDVVYEDEHPIFIIFHPNEISVRSVEWKGHQKQQ